jgi:hypothetical protein
MGLKLHSGVERVSTKERECEDPGLLQWPGPLFSHSQNKRIMVTSQIT